MLCKGGSRGLDIFTSQNPRYGFVEVILACFLLAKLEKDGLPFPLLQAVQFMMLALLKSGRFAKREVQAISAHERVVAFFERHDAMIVKSRRSAPNHHIAVGYWYATRFVSSLRSPKQKDGWDAKRDRDDRLTKVPLVFVLV